MISIPLRSGRFGLALTIVLRPGDTGSPPALPHAVRYDNYFLRLVFEGRTNNYTVIPACMRTGSARAGISQDEECRCRLALTVVLCPGGYRIPQLALPHAVRYDNYLLSISFEGRPSLYTVIPACMCRGCGGSRYLPSRSA